MPFKTSFDNTPKSLKEIQDSGNKTFKQTYDLIVVKVEEPYEGTYQGRAFTVQNIDVSDGTDTMRMSFTPDQNFNSKTLKEGVCLHVEQAYAARKEGENYWNLKIKQYKADGTGGSMAIVPKIKGLEMESVDRDWAEFKPIYEAVDAGNDPSKTVGNIDLSEYKKTVDKVFGILYDQLDKSMSEKDGESEALAWVMSDNELNAEIEILREAGLMSE